MWVFCSQFDVLRVVLAKVAKFLGLRVAVLPKLHKDDGIKDQRAAAVGLTHTGGTG